MSGQADRNLALSVFGRLNGKPIGRQSVFQLNGNNAAVSSVANPPNVRKVGLLQVSARDDLAGVGGINVRRTQRQFDTET